MAKFAGTVGYAVQEETTPGVWKDVIKERKMKGDLLKRSSYRRDGEEINDSISLNHRISVLGDAFAYENYFNIKYVKMGSIKWKVTGVEVERPRLILSIGDIYHG